MEEIAVGRVWIERSLQCHRACMEAIANARARAPHEVGELVGLLVRCAAVSKSAADLLADGSSLGGDALRLAAHVCAEGEAACRRIGADDLLFVRCADACAGVVFAYEDARERRCAPGGDAYAGRAYPGEDV